MVEMIVETRLMNQKTAVSDSSVFIVAVKWNELTQHLTQKIVGFTVTVNKAILPISNQIFYRIYAKVYTYFTIKSFDIAPNILYTVLFIVNCNECLSAEFLGKTSVLCKRISKH